MNNTFSYTMKSPCVFSVWPIWAFINSAKQASWVYANITDSYGEKINHFLPSSCISCHSNDVMHKQPIERSVTWHSDDGWGSSLFKKLAGRGGHHRVIRCASGMAICLPHEAVSCVACRRACILIGLLCSPIDRCRLIKKSADWSAGQSIGRPLGTTGLQRAQKSPCYTSLYLLALATSSSSHQVQDTDACI